MVHIDSKAKLFEKKNRGGGRKNNRGRGTEVNQGYEFDAMRFPFATHVVDDRGQLSVSLQKHSQPRVSGQLLHKGPGSVCLGGHLHTDFVWDFF